MCACVRENERETEREQALIIEMFSHWKIADLRYQELPANLRGIEEETTEAYLYRFMYLVQPSKKNTEVWT